MCFLPLSPVVQTLLPFAAAADVECVHHVTASDSCPLEPITVEPLVPSSNTGSWTVSNMT